MRAHCAPARDSQEHERPSERAGGRAATSPIFIRRSYVVNSWDGRAERGNAMEEEEKQAASAKTFKLSEGRRKAPKLPKSRTYYTYWLWSPFPHRDPPSASVSRLPFRLMHAYVVGETDAFAFDIIHNRNPSSDAAQATTFTSCRRPKNEKRILPTPKGPITGKREFTQL